MQIISGLKICDDTPRWIMVVLCQSVNAVNNGNWIHTKTSVVMVPDTYIRSRKECSAGFRQRLMTDENVPVIRIPYLKTNKQISKQKTDQCSYIMQREAKCHLLYQVSVVYNNRLFRYFRAHFSTG